jgi:hypothetical protein
MSTRGDGNSAVRPRPLQFFIRPLLIAQAAIAAIIAIVVAAPSTICTGSAYVVIFALVISGARGLCRSQPPMSRLGISALCVAVGLELYAAHLAYDTIGEISSGGLVLLVSFNIPAAILLACGYRWVPLGLIVGLAMFIVPEQLRLLHKWNRCEEEARSVIAYLESSKKRSGAYPDDLSGYRFLHPELIGDFHYGKDLRYSSNEVLPYRIRYHIGTETTSHDYSPTRGWFYYPD